MHWEIRVSIKLKCQKNISKYALLMIKSGVSMVSVNKNYSILYYLY